MGYFPAPVNIPGYAPFVELPIITFPSVKLEFTYNTPERLTVFNPNRGFLENQIARMV